MTADSDERTTPPHSPCEDIETLVREMGVVAIEPVLALVLTTEDFAAFAGEYPYLPDIMKQQTYDRTTGPDT